MSETRDQTRNLMVPSQIRFCWRHDGNSLTQTSYTHLLHAWSLSAFGFETFSLKEQRLVIWHWGD